MALRYIFRYFLVKKSLRRLVVFFLRCTEDQIEENSQLLIDYSQVCVKNNGKSKHRAVCC